MTEVDPRHPKHSTILCGPGTHRDNEASRMIPTRELPSGPSFNNPNPESLAFRALLMRVPAAMKEMEKQRRR